MDTFTFKSIFRHKKQGRVLARTKQMKRLIPKQIDLQIDFFYNLHLYSELHVKKRQTIRQIDRHIFDSTQRLMEVIANTRQTNKQMQIDREMERLLDRQTDRQAGNI